MAINEYYKVKHFWVTNITKMNISLSDLNLTIPAFSSINLLDNKHYKYTIDQLEKSAKTGSLAKKRNKICVRKVPPTVMQLNKPFASETYIPSRERSIVEIKYEVYEELQLDDEDFAKENADTAAIDSQQQVISKG